MHKIIGVISLAAMFIGCSREFNSNSSDDSDSASKDLSSRFVNIPVSTAPNTTPINSMTLDILCPNALPGNQNWSDTAAIIEYNKQKSIRLIKNTKCTITLKKYKDTEAEYTTSDPLVISVAENGIITMNKVTEYSTQANEKMWFAAAGKGPYSLVIANNLKKEEATLNLFNTETVFTAFEFVSSPSLPTVKNLKMSITPDNKGNKDYSLFAEVGNYKNCKIIAASKFDDFNYKSIDSVFRASPNETNCPNNIFTGEQGNWNTFKNNDDFIFLQNLDESEIFASYTYFLIQKQE